MAGFNLANNTLPNCVECGITVCPLDKQCHTNHCDSRISCVNAQDPEQVDLKILDNISKTVVFDYNVRKTAPDEKKYILGIKYNEKEMEDKATKINLFVSTILGHMLDTEFDVDFKLEEIEQ